MTDQAGVLAALDAVRDPELDEPVTELGFVSSCTVSDDGDVLVRLRLPTYFCAPNFAFLMVADAYDAVSALEGVRRTEVLLDDHFASDAINTGIAARSGFAESFEGLADGELDELRTDFVRKAVLAGTDRVCGPLLAGGLTADDAAALLVDATTGEAIGVEALPLHLRRARLTRVNTEANGSMCRGMLSHRYGTRGEGQLEEIP